MKSLKTDAVPDPCPVCERPNHHPSDHHMVPRSRGGKATTTICRDCHSAIHATFTNKELERAFNTVETLLAHEGFAKMVAFIRKQNPMRKQAFKRTKESRRRGAGG